MTNNLLSFFITGTSRGIGLEITKQLLESNHQVFATARTPEKSKDLINLKEKYAKNLTLFSLDVTSDNDVQNLNKKLTNTKIDVIINNAGVYLDSEKGLQKLESKILEETFQTNTFGPVRVTQALLENLKMSKTPKLINITSLMGSISDNSSGGYYAYRMSKAALNMFNKSFSVDHPQITSLVIHPGWVQTDMGGKQAPTQPEESARGIIKVILNSRLEDSGKFFDFEGDEVGW